VKGEERVSLFLRSPSFRASGGKLPVRVECCCDKEKQRLRAAEPNGRAQVAARGRQAGGRGARSFASLSLSPP